MSLRKLELSALENEIESLPELSTDKITETIEAAVVTKKNYAERNLYGTSENLVHRLFVCIAGVADQLQTNYSSDVRKVLKMVLQPVEVVPVFEICRKMKRKQVLKCKNHFRCLLLLESDGSLTQTATNAPHAAAFSLWSGAGITAEIAVVYSVQNAHQISCVYLNLDMTKSERCNLCFLYKINPFSSPLANTLLLPTIPSTEFTAFLFISSSHPNDLLPSSSVAQNFISTGFSSSNPQRDNNNSGYGIPS
uniref:Uncharacterized protein n=1 Tax=Ditylenchus dipsaci TaxID=166011 RepID=A0A915D266_9BILA